MSQPLRGSATILAAAETDLCLDLDDGHLWKDLLSPSS